MRVTRSTWFAAMLAGLLGALPATAAAAADTTPATAAGWAATYVATAIGADGAVAGPSGPNHTATANAVLALVAAGAGETEAAAATAYLAAHVEDAVVKSGADQPGSLALLVLVATARGLDPHAFGGTAPGNDLVARLLATKQTSGADTGLFGAADATYDGAYRQSLGLLALAAAGTTDEQAVAWLVAEQCADGGWMGNRPDQSAPCPAFDANTFVGEDTNSTALAAQALATLDVTPAHDPLDFLGTAQNADGGFGFVPGFGTDANSTALAIQALVAAGESPTGADWTAPDGTPFDALLALQLGCDAPAKDRGAFAFDGSAATANLFATLQAVPALVVDPYPIASRTLTPGLPGGPSCGVVSTDPPRITPSASPAAPATSPRPRVLPGVAELPATGGPGRKPWDATGLAVFGLGLVGYGVLALGAARLTRKRCAD